jgi:opacity protein-like surface antigen
MKKLLAAAVLAAALLPAAQAQTVGDSVNEAGREVKKAAKKAHDVVWTRCADGRKTVKGKAGCNGHGGVAYTAPKPDPAPAPAPK